MNSHTPTPNTANATPGEGSHPSPAGSVSPGALPPFVRVALRDFAELVCGDWLAHDQEALVDSFEKIQPILTDDFADAMAAAFGVDFPKSSAKSDAWARRKGLLPIPDEPLSGVEGIPNLARINYAIRRLEGLRAAQEALTGIEISPVKIRSIVKDRGGAEWAVTSLRFDGQELIIKTGFLLLTFVLEEKLFGSVTATRDAAVAKYDAAQAALEAEK